MGDKLKWIKLLEAYLDHLNMVWLMEDSDFVVSFCFFGECVYFNEKTIPYFLNQFNSQEFLNKASRKVSCQRIIRELKERERGVSNK